jgi:sec-independent protein translocase protein TatA
MDFSLVQIAIVLVIALLVFGPKRLPELGRTLGKGMREFRQSVSGLSESVLDADEPEEAEEPAVASKPNPSTAPADREAGTAETKA